MKYIYVILLTGGLLISCNKTVVKFKFIKKIKINQEFKYPAKLINNKNQLIHIFNQEHKPLYNLKNYINFNEYNFDMYDYLLIFNNELSNIEPANDDCDYLSKTPIKISYKKYQKYQKYIYIYQLLDKNKYRDLCP